jgi:hypothetical protein
VSHANAALTPRARLRLARLIIDDGWPPSGASKMFMVSTVTAGKWAARFRAEGEPGMAGRSSRPHSMPRCLPDTTRAGPTDRAGPVASTSRSGPDRRRARPATIDRSRRSAALPDQPTQSHRPVTGEPFRRYEHDHPGALIHSTSRSSPVSPVMARLTPPP